MIKKQIVVGLLGFGNVGTGTYQALEMNREAIKEQSGLDISIGKILVRDPQKDRSISIPPGVLTDDAGSILNDPTIDIVVELLGGLHPAGELMLQAMNNGKHVVTANKAALAANFKALEKAAIDNGVQLRYEASVAGGIPILNAIRTALCSNQILEIKGILNGTTNYMLTQMTDHGLAYDDVLKTAQEKGFAEADPTDDVEGYDVANKLSILIALAFGTIVSPKDIPTKGISGITKEFIGEAKSRNNKIKLIATARNNGAGLEYRVEPEEIPFHHPLAGVNNEFNAIFIEGNAVGELMFYGRGAGPLPTGSAVLGDIIDIGKTIVPGRV
ncbi:MAG: homoserine dehydrogenase [Firmicutes bacterium HGW-Firmicutes-11]|jgi:homoserine dehydrogenase|nr:MAG: homoserine dehydrogenase [Firmicutes bacterium HGW-Firmicutes-11]